MDLAEMIVDAARRKQVAEASGTLLQLQVGDRRIEYHVTRRDGDTFVWYPYVRGSASPFCMRLPTNNLPNAYLVATAMLSTLVHGQEPPSDDLRVLACRAEDPSVIMYDRTVRARGDPSTDPVVLRAVREAFILALHGV